MFANSTLIVRKRAFVNVSFLIFPKQANPCAWLYYIQNRILPVISYIDY